jgi:hypothetical protein
MHWRVKDLSGRRFGTLVVTEFAEMRGRRAHWHTVCDCGERRVVAGGNLLSGNTTSCGCVMLAGRAARLRTHGRGGPRRTREYRAWQEAKRRCFDAGRPSFKDYGGRGITMCDAWRVDFAAFFGDMGECPKGLTLDRIDHDGDYEPGNCRWATSATQNRNKRTNIWVQWGGDRMVLRDFAAARGVSYSAIKGRVGRGEDPVEAANAIGHRKPRQPSRPAG